MEHTKQSKRKLSRLLSLILALAMVFAMLPVSGMTVYAESTTEPGTETWSIDQCWFTPYNGDKDAGKYVICYIYSETADNVEAAANELASTDGSRLIATFTSIAYMDSYGQLRDYSLEYVYTDIPKSVSLNHIYGVVVYTNDAVKTFKVLQCVDSGGRMFSDDTQYGFTSYRNFCEKTVTVTAGENGTVDKAIIPGVAVDTEISAEGNVLTVGTTTVTATADEGYVFDSWTGIPENGKITEDTEIFAVWKNASDGTTSITDEVATKIKNANTTSVYDSTKLNTLYGVGETNLTTNDVVTVNGVDCYVLSVDTTNNTAQLITKNIYDVRFDDGGHNSTNVEGHVGTDSQYTNKTYDYKYSTLKTWMDNFYSTTTSGQGLNNDSRIIQTNAKYYVGVSSISSTTTPTGTVSQYVYALDAVEAKTNLLKFGSDSWSN